MGRTGRRTGSTRNCLFLATRDEALLQSAGLIDLWESGYVEPTVPPVEPYHVLAQQLMALILQESGIGRRTWFEWVCQVPAFSQMPAEQIESVVQWMLEHEMLWDEEGILGIGRAGEEEYGRRHFMELLSVFLSPPLFAVLHGRQEIGFVDELTFLGKKEGPRVLLLGGSGWQVTHIDWSRKVAFVEATDERGRSHWKGEGRGLSFRLCQAIKAVLTSSDVRPCWSLRAQKQFAEIRADFDWLLSEATTTVLVNANGESTWWTFAGIGANASLAAALSEATQCRVSHESFSLTFEQHLRTSEIEQAIKRLQQRNVDDLMPSVDERALQSLKFSDCLPTELALQILQKRLHDRTGVQHAIRETPRFVIARN
jgi:ATP-dependent Lhr-like helicase